MRFWGATAAVAMAVVSVGLGAVIVLAAPAASGAKLAVTKSAAAKSDLPFPFYPFIHATDVSPDAPYASARGRPGDGDPSGVVVSIVIDPKEPAMLYVASQSAGVWKSINGARTWRQRSTGLLSGITGRNGRSNLLAIDETRPARLLYAAQDDDLRAPRTWGGLYRTTDSAGSWDHVDLPGCPGPDVSAIAFRAGRAFVATRCGIVTSTDLTSWSFFPSPFGPADADNSRIAAGSASLFACKGSKVWRSSSLGVTATWSAPITLPDARVCYELAPAPDGTDTVLVVDYARLPNEVDVAKVDFSSRTSTSLNFDSSPVAPSPVCCGTLTIATARRPGTTFGGGPGRSYDVFAADAFFFHQYVPQGHSDPDADWPVLAEAGGRLHPDTWSIAIRPDYDPSKGRCGVYLGTDGGVFANVAAGPTCMTKDGPWRRAMSGLHLMNSFTMAGVDEPCTVGGAKTRCRGLYLPTGDDGTWASNDRGAHWQDMGCCGDSGAAFVDPALPAQVVTARNGIYALYRSLSGAAVSGIPEFVANFVPPDAFPGINPPGLGGFVQIMTPRGAVASPQGDYLAVVSPSRAGTGGCGPSSALDACRDRIVRNTGGKAGPWQDISPANHFPPGWITAITAGGGHDRTTVYAMSDHDRLGGNQLFRGRIGPAGTLESPWKALLGGTFTPANVFVNPYDPREVYITDVENETIRSSRDSGITWQREDELNAIATRGGEFRFDCGPPANAAGSGAFSNLCALSALVFDRDDPNLRFAVLTPGGVAFSRDGGGHWAAVEGATALRPTDPVGLPYSGFYESTPDPKTKRPSLYVALLGRGILRVQAPYARLEVITFEYCSSCVPGLRDVHKVVAVDSTTKKSLSLHRDSDGKWHGAELVDPRLTPRISYAFRVRGHHESERFHVLGRDERQTGAATLDSSRRSVVRAYRPPRATRHRDCRRGLLPDRHCTPGALAPRFVLSEGCRLNTRAGVRGMTLRRRALARAAYGAGDGAAVDELIPASLGGSASLANLWVQSKTDLRRKDALERRLSTRVCAGTLSLGIAQLALAGNWLRALR